MLECRSARVNSIHHTFCATINFLIDKEDEIRTRTLGRGPALTELGLGTSPFGNLFRETTDTATQDATAAAWAGGVRYFDTAPHYGLGLSESRLGAALAKYPRDDYAISTKVGRLLVPT